jgi:hypothetical protein
MIVVKMRVRRTAHRMRELVATTAELDYHKFACSILVSDCNAILKLLLLTNYTFLCEVARGNHRTTSWTHLVFVL